MKMQGTDYSGKTFSGWWNGKTYYDVYFAQTVETVEDAEIDGWHEERIFYIFEKNEVLEWGKYEIVKISNTYGNMYSCLVSDKVECEKILSMFPELPRLE